MPSSMMTVVAVATNVIIIIIIIIIIIAGSCLQQDVVHTTRNERSQGHMDKHQGFIGEQGVESRKDTAIGSKTSPQVIETL